ncbi:hypothetical protein BN946_scf184709.g6 [Trametes cinnabarina]|uniref:Uncharacterized protein n=1 Tax=Pycnoporus cinnabarinus TaxID=5643 RepID=A0A060SXH9_PYCCI|nr:hypothetical protein BN946_scf184709.g6 [Trametes cinnabarina]
MSSSRSTRSCRLDTEGAASKKPHVPLLSEDERDALEALVRPSRLLAQRTIYRKVIHGCCMLHIHHLWRTFDAREDRPLTDYLIEYFPAFFTRDPDLLGDCARALRDCPWHYKLTDDELDENRAVGAQAARFVSAAGRYTEDPQAYCEQNGYDPDASFDDLFPPPDPGSISAAIMHFVEKVQLAHDGLQSMLDDHEE